MLSGQGCPRRNAVDGRDQRFRGEWLVKVCDTAGFNRFTLKRLVVHGGNEDDRKVDAHVLQMMPQLDPRHATEVDIKDDTAYHACLCMAEERFSRCVAFGHKPVCAQQALDASAHARIVIDHRHCAR
jgi:hypothetical protein